MKATATAEWDGGCEEIASATSLKGKVLSRIATLGTICEMNKGGIDNWGYEYDGVISITAKGGHHFDGNGCHEWNTHTHHYQTMNELYRAFLADTEGLEIVSCYGDSPCDEFGCFKDNECPVWGTKD